MTAHQRNRHKQLRINKSFLLKHFKFEDEDFFKARNDIYKRINDAFMIPDGKLFIQKTRENRHQTIENFKAQLQKYQVELLNKVIQEGKASRKPDILMLWGEEVGRQGEQGPPGVSNDE